MTTTRGRAPASLTVAPAHHHLWPLDDPKRAPLCSGPHGGAGDGTYARAVGALVVVLRSRQRSPLELTVRVPVCQACADHLRVAPYRSIADARPLCAAESATGAPA